jgi:AcrR family transcriptional regulator
MASAAEFRPPEPTAASSTVRAGVWPRRRPSEIQRERILSAMVEVCCEVGVQNVTIAAVIKRARISRRTFYDLFEDRLDCFLAAFDTAIAKAEGRIAPACAVESSWIARVRAGLAELLVFFDEDPELARLCVVEALAAGPSVLERRRDVLGRLAEALDDGGSAAAGGHAHPLRAEAVVGSVLAVIHGRLTDSQPQPMIDLLGPLVGMVALPYLGVAEARREHARAHVPRPVLPVRVDRPAAREPLNGLDVRVTYRTLCVLDAVAAQPGASNRAVGAASGIADQGQISRLLSRLRGVGLVENASEPLTPGDCNAWSLTAKGAEVQRAATAWPGRWAVG